MHIPLIVIFTSKSVSYYHETSFSVAIFDTCFKWENTYYIYIFIFYAGWCHMFTCLFKYV